MKVKARALKAAVTSLHKHYGGKSAPFPPRVWIRSPVGGVTVVMTRSPDGFATKTVLATGVMAKRICVNGAVLKKLLKGIDSKQELEISVSGTHVAIAAGRMVATIDSLDEEPPEPPSWLKTHTLTIDAAEFRERAIQTMWAASTDVSRPVLQSVFLEVCNGSGTITGTNGHVLLTRNGLRVKGGKASVMLPARLLRAVTDMAKKPEGDAVITFDDRRVQVQIDKAGLCLTEYVHQCAYPNYRQVIPEDGNRTITVARSELQEVVGTMAGVVSDVTYRLVFVCDARGVFALAGDVRDDQVSALDVTAEFVGEPIEFAVNNEYLKAMVKHMGETVVMRLNTPERAIVMTSPDVPGLKGMVMPLRLLDTHDWESAIAPLRPSGS